MFEVFLKEFWEGAKEVINLLIVGLACLLVIILNFMVTVIGTGLLLFPIPLFIGLGFGIVSSVLIGVLWFEVLIILLLRLVKLSKSGKNSI